ncbi:hypothetical protein PMAYCL1PPCAC_10821, partial [Pristionchus mayeri]
KGRVFHEFSPMMHRLSLLLLFIDSSPLSQKKFDVWGSTYNKLFELLRDDELPKSLRGRRRTAGDGNEVDTNRKRVVSEIQQRNTRLSTQDDRSINLSPSPTVNLIDRVPPSYRTYRHQEPVYGTVWKGHSRGGSSSLPTRRFDLPTFELEEIHEDSNYRSKGNAANQPQNRPNGTNSAVNNHNGYRYAPMMSRSSNIGLLTTLPFIIIGRRAMTYPAIIIDQARLLMIYRKHKRKSSETTIGH